jgi:hypothetical protein
MKKVANKKRTWVYFLNKLCIFGFAFGLKEGQFIYLTLSDFKI